VPTKQRRVAATAPQARCGVSEWRVRTALTVRALRHALVRRWRRRTASGADQRGRSPPGAHVAHADAHALARAARDTAASHHSCARRTDLATGSATGAAATFDAVGHAIVVACVRPRGGAPARAPCALLRGGERHTERVAVAARGTPSLLAAQALFEVAGRRVHGRRCMRDCARVCFYWRRCWHRSSSRDALLRCCSAAAVVCTCRTSKTCGGTS
jgi:hypothetical protein